MTATLIQATQEAALRAILRDIAAQPEVTTGEPLARLVGALRPAGRADLDEATARVQGLQQLLAADPALAAGLSAHLQAVLRSRMHRTLYAESGILTSTGFLTGLWSRLLGRLLPPAVDPDFLRDLVAEVFDEPRDAAWVAAVPLEAWQGLFDTLGCFGVGFAAVRAHMRHELFEAMRMTSHRLAALGMEPALLRYVPALARHESPFLAQSDEVRTLLARHDGRAEAAPPYDGHLDVLLRQCLDYVTRIRKRSREAGVGVNLVFILARVEQLVERLRTLRQLAVPDAATPATTTQRLGTQFALQLVRAENRRHRLSQLFEGTTQLLARRVTEHASKSGEHYVSETRDEYRAAFRAAAGAGLIVGVMALAKILVAALQLPGFWQAVGFSLVYGLGFVVIHMLHLTVATKQPAMTAATLAAALDGTPDPAVRVQRLTALAAQVSRTQWVSIAGNVVIGFLTALAIAMVGGTFLGWEPVTAEKAEHLLHELHPWRSLALLHAGIAGVYLFLSGLISGYYDNQSLFYRVPERLRRVKWMRRWLGQRRTDAVAAYVEHNLGALMGNFLFGCMLGATGTVGAFFGLPVDIRHVSFAAANLAYAWQATGFAVPWPLLLTSAAGVLMIGLVNLVVSFVLALKVAIRSRGIGPEGTDGLLASVLTRLRQAPGEFILPPRAPRVDGP
jgi:site-specific recombinase